MIRIVTALVVATLATITSCSEKHIKMWDKTILEKPAINILSSEK